MSERPFAPAAERNRAPIVEVLKDHLPAGGTVLEVASGTGQHVCHFAGELPELLWQPSERDVTAVKVLELGLAGVSPVNVLPPIVLDVTRRWPALMLDAVIAANITHIAPAATTQALCLGAAGVCRAGGILHIYGPFKQAGQHTSEGNAAFDASLRQQDVSLGIRDVEWLIDAAAEAGFELRELRAMPANNFSVVFIRGS